jgi:hypothetical protein
MPTKVRAVGRDSIVKGIADVAFVSLTFASGIVANVELSWLAPSKLRRTVLVGSERMVTYDDAASEPVRLFDSGVVYRDLQTFGEYHLSYRSGDIVSPRIDSDEPLGLELRDFLQAIRTGQKMEFHTALARSVVRIVEAADRSLTEGGREISLEPGPADELLAPTPRRWRSPERRLGRGSDARRGPPRAGFGPPAEQCPMRLRRPRPGCGSRGRGCRRPPRRAARPW